MTNDQTDQVLDAFESAGHTVINNLILRNYRRVGMTTAQFMVYLQLKSYLDQGIASPDIAQVATDLGTDENQVFELMHQMIQHQFLTHETKTDSYGKQSDYYNFSRFTKKISHLVTQQQTQQVVQQTTSERETIFNKIEVEFGRPLSPIELETVAKWFDEDHYAPKLIELALQEAVLNQAWNLKYMDRILRSWEKQHITTAQQVDQLRQSHLQQTSSANQSKKMPTGPDIPLFKIGD